MPRILLLITTQSYRAGAFMEAARTLGVDLTIGSERTQALASLNPIGHLDLDFRDHPASIARIVDFTRRQPIDAVVAADDDGALLAARASRALGRSAHPPEAVAMARDKLAAREAFAHAGLKTPEYVTIPAGDDPRAWRDRVPFPCVIKPRGLSASRGVIRADDLGQFVAAFERIGAMLAAEAPRAAGEPPGDSLLVERFIPGAEVALEGVMSVGQLQTLAIFDKPDPLDGPYFEETIYVTPSRKSEAEQRAIRETAAAATRAVGLAHGPVHAEFRCNAEGVWPLEIAPRSIGGLCSRALRFDGGETLESLLLRHALGLDVRYLGRESAASGVMMIPIPRAGILRGIRGIEAARGVPQVTELRVTIPIGARLTPLPEGAQYLGFVFARGAEPETVEQALRDAHQRLEFDIEPE